MSLRSIKVYDVYKDEAINVNIIKVKIYKENEKDDKRISELFVNDSPFVLSVYRR